MLNFDKPQTTRIAPSPTGNAHIGLVRTAYLNYLAARSSGGKFIVRIDDTDKERSKKEYEDNILKTFEWLGLEWDEIHYQSTRFDRYKEVAEQLLSNGSVREEGGAIKLGRKDVMNAHWYRPSWPDIIQGETEINHKDKTLLESIFNLVLLRTDGSSTYHFASCVDDMDMGISLIIRGTDHFTNTHKHNQIFAALEELPEFYKELPERKQFAHVGLIFHDGKKISKRDGVSSMEYYKEKYVPNAVLNAVLKLGWGHTDPNIDKKLPLIDKETAIHVFPEGKLKAAKSTLDLNKLDWYQKRYGR